VSPLLDVCRRMEHVDTDAAGVVHFARYASLLETAVLENLERLGVGVLQLGDDRLELAISELRMNYFASARFYDLVRIGVSVDRVGGASATVSGSIHRDETLLASGTIVLCVVGQAGGGVAPLPERMRKALRDCLNGASHA